MDESELDEIVKLAGGPNFDPYKKQRREADKWRKANDTGISPFLIKRASAKQPERGTQQPLFGDLWRTGELAVLIGEPGVGKSLLATQLAEVIARAAKHSVNGVPTAKKPLRVIYFDFERTQEQFSSIYSCQPFPATPYREEYKFRFDIARLDICTDIPDAFKGSVDHYIRHWVIEEICEGNAKVFLIDSIAHLSIGTTVEKVMRALRVAVSKSGASVLVVAQAKPKRRPSAVTLADISIRALLDADTILAVARSTAHPDIRYVKDLKSRTSQLTADLPAALRSLLSEPEAIATGSNGAAVLSYRIERIASPILGGTEMIRNPNSQIPNPAGPFLGLNYLGLSLESKHLPQIRDSRSQISNRRPDRLPSATEALAQGIVDGSYAKYLLGE